MLDGKAKSLASQEKALKKKEQNFEASKKQWLRSLDSEY